MTLFRIRVEGPGLPTDYPRYMRAWSRGAWEVVTFSTHAEAAEVCRRMRSTEDRLDVPECYRARMTVEPVSEDIPPKCDRVPKETA